MKKLSETMVPVALAAVVSLSATACAAQRAPAALAAPAPPSYQERVLLSEDFRQYNPRYRQVRGQWAVIDGRLVQTRDDVRELNTMMFYDPLTIADAEVTADVTMLVDMPQFLQSPNDHDLINSKRRISGAGLLFRYQDENNFYLFRTAGEDGVVLGKVVNGQWSELANPRAADFAGTVLKMDTPYTLRVRIVGNRIQAWIADKAVVNLEDSSLATGRVGLATFRSKAAFQELRVVEK